MKSRRRVLSVLGTAVFAGCAGQTVETNTPETTTTNRSFTNNTQSQNETQQDSESKRKPLTGREIYFDWIHGKNDQIREEAKNDISLDAVNQALDKGYEKEEVDYDVNDYVKLEETGGITKAILTANSQYDNADSYTQRHRHVLSAVHQVLDNRDGDRWGGDFVITSMSDWAATYKYPSDGLNYSKIWIYGEDNDINIALNPKLRSPTAHTEGRRPQGDVEGILADIRKPDISIERPPHDYEALKEATEYYKENHNKEYTDEEIESGNGSWIEEFGNYIWGNGLAVPSSVEDWRKLHEGFESGDEMILNLNKAYFNSEYEEGKILQYKIEQESISVSDVPEGYIPDEDGIPRTPSA